MKKSEAVALVIQIKRKIMFNKVPYKLDIVFSVFFFILAIIQISSNAEIINVILGFMLILFRELKIKIDKLKDR